MEFGIDMTTKSIDILGKVLQAGSTFSDVSNIISVSAKLASAFPVVSAALMLIGSFVPGSQHDQVLRGIENLGRKIDQVRIDIQQLQNHISFEIAMELYADKEVYIDTGMQCLFEIANANDINEKTMHQKDLNETCASKTCTFALNYILARVPSILNKYYDKTGGNRPQMSVLAARLLKQICSGMAVVATYERIVHGQAGDVKLEKTLDRQWRSACASVKSALDKCTQNLKVNMLTDLNTFLYKGGSNEGLVAEIKNFMRDKYDWLENYCLVYDDVRGYDKHCFNGHRVESLHYNGKCGIVFYRMKGQPPRFSDRYDEVYRIVDATTCYGLFYHTYAEECYDSIVAALDRRGIGWTGCAVITMHSRDVRHASTFTTSTVFANIREVAGWGHSWKSVVAARGIVLLE